MMANIVYITQSYSNDVPVRSFCDLLDMTENFNNEFTSIRISRNFLSILLNQIYLRLYFKLPKRQVNNNHPNI